MDVIKSLAAFSRISKVKELEPPNSLCFINFKPRERPDVELLKSLISKEDPPFVAPRKSQPKHQARARTRHEEQCVSEGRRLAEHFLSQWPKEELSIDDFSSPLLNTSACLVRVKPHWQRLVENWNLSNFVSEVQSLLDQNSGPGVIEEPFGQPAKVSVSCPALRSEAIPCLAKGLLQKHGPPASAVHLNPVITKAEKPNGGNSESQEIPTGPSNGRRQRKEHHELKAILNNLQMAPDLIRKEYAQDLKRSLEVLTSFSTSEPGMQESPQVLGDIGSEIESCKAAIDRHAALLCKSFAAEDDRFQWLDIGGLWPCTSTVVMLEQLRSISGHSYGPNMKKALVQLGVLLTGLQRLYRLKEGRLKDDRRRVMEEMQNEGHTNWDPYKYPDWLLLELDANIMIREEQVLVAQAMIDPGSGKNSVLQMNMGKVSNKGLISCQSQSTFLY